MKWSLILVLLVAARRGGGVTKTSNNEGISQFWTDDYKVFDQIYGKTSDKEIYGATLPPSISYGIDVTNLRNFALDKKERYLDNDGQNSNLNNEQIDPYGFGSRYTYNSLLANEAVKALATKNPTKSPLKFVTGDFKPISHTSDPDTYNYLKHLEKLQKQKSSEYTDTLGGFKPYITYSGPNPEDTEAYKSIQDILEAHEANKGTKKGNEDDEQDYITYPPKNRSRAKKPKSSAPVVSKNKARCPSGRCRKRATTSYRVYTRPYVRRIKHKIIYSR